MPFTAAHPAAVLPFVGRLRVPYATSTLIVGSMAPDFEYFLRLRAAATISHTPAGLVLFCIPVGVLVLVAFQLVVKRPAAFLLPDWLRCRVAEVAPARQLRPTDGVAIVLLLLGGAATHLVWDGFTHSHGWAVERWPALSAPAATVFGVDVAVYKLLQHGSTLVGLVALATATAVWVHRQPLAAAVGCSLAPSVRWAVIGGIVLMSLTVGVVWAVVSVSGSTGRVLQTAIGRFVVAAVATLAVVVFIYSLFAGRRLRA